MFGKNALLKQDLDESGALWVQEMFHTIQGEGPFTGLPAVFIRLGGCNLKCHFCDTDFESSTWRPSHDELIDKFNALETAETTRLVVLTGGEPFRQNAVPLMTTLLAAGWTIQVETAGLLWLP